jgi:hypothetical protein
MTVTVAYSKVFLVRMGGETLVPHVPTMDNTGISMAGFQ